MKLEISFQAQTTAGTTQTYDRQIEFDTEMTEGFFGTQVLIVKYLLEELNVFQPDIDSDVPYCNTPLTWKDGPYFDKKTKYALYLYQKSRHQAIKSYIAQNLDIAESSSLSRDQIIDSQYKAALGTLSEATLAVMHGWHMRDDTTPRYTKLGYKFSSINQQDDPPGSSNLYRACQNILIRIVGIQNQESLLQNPVLDVDGSIDKNGQTGLSSSEYFQRPDPETYNGIPFDIGSSKVGHYVDTQFTVSEPPFFQNEEIRAQKMHIYKETAIVEVLRRYDLVFKNFEVNLSFPKDVFSSLYDVKRIKDDIQTQNFPNPQFADTRRVVERDLNLYLNINLQHDSTILFDLDEYIKHDRLIKFLGFIPPSFRPGSVYKAEFILNKRIFETLLELKLVPGSATALGSSEIINIGDLNLRPPSVDLEGNIIDEEGPTVQAAAASSPLNTEQTLREIAELALDTDEDANTPLDAGILIEDEWRELNQLTDPTMCIEEDLNNLFGSSSDSGEAALRSALSESRSRNEFLIEQERTKQQKKYNRRRMIDKLREDRASKLEKSRDASATFDSDKFGNFSAQASARAGQGTEFSGVGEVGLGGGGVDVGDMLGDTATGLQSLFQPDLKEAKVKNPLVVTLSDLQSDISKVASFFEKSQKDLEEFARNPDAKAITPEINLKEQAQELKKLSSAFETLVSEALSRAKNLRVNPSSVILTIDLKTDPDTRKKKIQEVRMKRDKNTIIREGSYRNFDTINEFQQGVIPTFSDAGVDILNIPSYAVGYLIYLKKILTRSVVTQNLTGGCFSFLKPSAALGVIQSYTIPAPFMKPKVEDTGWPLMAGSILDSTDEVRQDALNYALSFEKGVLDWSITGSKIPLDDVKPGDLFTSVCNLEQVYLQFLDKFNISALLCQVLKCMGLWPMNIDLDLSFKLPPIPKLPTFSYLGQLGEIIKREIIKAIASTLCRVAQQILDLLKLDCRGPDISLSDRPDYGDLRNQIPEQANNILEAVKDMGFPIEFFEDAKGFVDDVSSLLSPSELCGLYKGQSADKVKLILLNLLKVGYSDTLSKFMRTEREVEQFFAKLGLFGASEICDALENALADLGADADKPLEDCACVDGIPLREKLCSTADSAGINLTPVQCDAALEIARNNREKVRKAFEDLANGKLMENIIPDIRDFSDPSSPLFNVPDSFKEILKTAIKGSFSAAKREYYDDISNYVPYMYSTEIQVSTDSQITNGANYAIERRKMEIMETLRVHNFWLAVMNPDDNNLFNLGDRDNFETEAIYSLYAMLYPVFKERYAAVGPGTQEPTSPVNLLDLGGAEYLNHGTSAPSRVGNIELDRRYGRGMASLKKLLELYPSPYQSGPEDVEKLFGGESYDYYNAHFVPSFSAAKIALNDFDLVTFEDARDNLFLRILNSIKAYDNDGLYLPYNQGTTLYDAQQNSLQLFTFPPNADPSTSGPIVEGREKWIKFPVTNTGEGQFRAPIMIYFNPPEFTCAFENQGVATNEVRTYGLRDFMQGKLNISNGETAQENIGDDSTTPIPTLSMRRVLIEKVNNRVLELVNELVSLISQTSSSPSQNTRVFLPKIKDLFKKESESGREYSRYMLGIARAVLDSSGDPSLPNEVVNVASGFYDGVTIEAPHTLNELSNFLVNLAAKANVNSNLYQQVSQSNVSRIKNMFKTLTTLQLDSRESTPYQVRSVYTIHQDPFYTKNYGPNSYAEAYEPIKLYSCKTMDADTINWVNENLTADSLVVVENATSFNSNSYVYYNKLLQSGSADMYRRFDFGDPRILIDYGQSYKLAKEFIMEDVLDIISDSNFMSDPEYIGLIENKLRGAPYYEESTDSQGCPVKNRRFSPVDILINFDEEVELALGRMLDSMRDPEAFRTIDFKKPSPFEKGLRDTAANVLVKVLIYEFALRAGPAMAAFDANMIMKSDFVMDFIIKWILNYEVRNNPRFQKDELDRDPPIIVRLFKESLMKLTGKSTPEEALRKIISEEYAGVAKKINDLFGTFSPSTKLGFYSRLSYGSVWQPSSLKVLNGQIEQISNGIQVNQLTCGTKVINNRRIDVPGLIEDFNVSNQNNPPPKGPSRNPDGAGCSAAIEDPTTPVQLMAMSCIKEEYLPEFYQYVYNKYAEMYMVQDDSLGNALTDFSAWDIQSKGGFSLESYIRLKGELAIKYSRIYLEFESLKENLDSLIADPEVQLTPIAPALPPLFVDRLLGVDTSRIGQDANARREFGDEQVDPETDFGVGQTIRKFSQLLGVGQSFPMPRLPDGAGIGMGAVRTNVPGATFPQHHPSQSIGYFQNPRLFTTAAGAMAAQGVRQMDQVTNFANFLESVREYAKLTEYDNVVISPAEFIAFMRGDLTDPLMRNLSAELEQLGFSGEECNFKPLFAKNYPSKFIQLDRIHTVIDSRHLNIGGPPGYEVHDESFQKWGTANKTANSWYKFLGTPFEHYIKGSEQAVDFEETRNINGWQPRRYFAVPYNFCEHINSREKEDLVLSAENKWARPPGEQDRPGFDLDMSSLDDVDYDRIDLGQLTPSKYFNDFVSSYSLSSEAFPFNHNIHPPNSSTTGRNLENESYVFLNVRDNSSLNDLISHSDGTNVPSRFSGDSYMNYVEDISDPQNKESKLVFESVPHTQPLSDIYTTTKSQDLLEEVNESLSKSDLYSQFQQDNDGNAVYEIPENLWNSMRKVKDDEFERYNIPREELETYEHWTQYVIDVIGFAAPMVDAGETFHHTDDLPVIKNGALKNEIEASTSLLWWSKVYNNPNINDTVNQIERVLPKSQLDTGLRKPSTRRKKKGFWNAVKRGFGVGSGWSRQAGAPVFEYPTKNVNTKDILFQNYYIPSNWGNYNSSYSPETVRRIEGNLPSLPRNFSMFKQANGSVIERHLWTMNPRSHLRWIFSDDNRSFSFWNMAYHAMGTPKILNHLNIGRDRFSPARRIGKGYSRTAQYNYGEGSGLYLFNSVQYVYDYPQDPQRINIDARGNLPDRFSYRIWEVYNYSKYSNFSKLYTLAKPVYNTDLSNNISIDTDSTGYDRLADSGGPTDFDGEGYFNMLAYQDIDVIGTIERFDNKVYFLNLYTPGIEDISRGYLQDVGSNLFNQTPSKTILDDIEEDLAIYMSVFDLQNDRNNTVKMVRPLGLVPDTGDLEYTDAMIDREEWSIPIYNLSEKLASAEQDWHELRAYLPDIHMNHKWTYEKSGYFNSIKYPHQGEYDFTFSDDHMFNSAIKSIYSNESKFLHLKMIADVIGNENSSLEKSNNLIPEDGPVTQFPSRPHLNRTNYYRSEGGRYTTDSFPQIVDEYRSRYSWIKRLLYPPANAHYWAPDYKQTVARAESNYEPYEDDDGNTVTVTMQEAEEVLNTRRTLKNEWESPGSGDVLFDYLATLQIGGGYSTTAGDFISYNFLNPDLSSITRNSGRRYRFQVDDMFSPGIQDDVTMYMNLALPPRQFDWRAVGGDFGDLTEGMDYQPGFPMNYSIDQLKEAFSSSVEEFNAGSYHLPKILQQHISSEDMAANPDKAIVGAFINPDRRGLTGFNFKNLQYDEERIEFKTRIRTHDEELTPRQYSEMIPSFTYVGDCPYEIEGGWNHWDYQNSQNFARTSETSLRPQADAKHYEFKKLFAGSPTLGFSYRRLKTHPELPVARNRAFYPSNFDDPDQYYITQQHALGSYNHNEDYGIKPGYMVYSRFEPSTDLALVNGDGDLSFGERSLLYFPKKKWSNPTDVCGQISELREKNLPRLFFFQRNLVSNHTHSKNQVRVPIRFLVTRADLYIGQEKVDTNTYLGFDIPETLKGAEVDQINDQLVPKPNMSRKAYLQTGLNTCIHEYLDYSKLSKMTPVEYIDGAHEESDGTSFTESGGYRTFEKPGINYWKMHLIDRLNDMKSNIGNAKYFDFLLGSEEQLKNLNYKNEHINLMKDCIRAQLILYTNRDNIKLISGVAGEVPGAEGGIHSQIRQNLIAPLTALGIAAAADYVGDLFTRDNPDYEEPVQLVYGDHVDPFTYAVLASSKHYAKGGTGNIYPLSIFKWHWLYMNSNQSFDSNLAFTYGPAGSYPELERAKIGENGALSDGILRLQNGGLYDAEDEQLSSIFRGTADVRSGGSPQEIFNFVSTRREIETNRASSYYGYAVWGLATGFENTLISLQSIPSVVRGVTNLKPSRGSNLGSSIRKVFNFDNPCKDAYAPTVEQLIDVSKKSYENEGSVAYWYKPQNHAYGQMNFERQQSNFVNKGLRYIHTDSQSPKNSINSLKGFQNINTNQEDINGVMQQQIAVHKMVDMHMSFAGHSNLMDIEYLSSMVNRESFRLNPSYDNLAEEYLTTGYRYREDNLNQAGRPYYYRYLFSGDRADQVGRSGLAGRDANHPEMRGFFAANEPGRSRSSYNRDTQAGDNAYDGGSGLRAYSILGSQQASNYVEKFPAGFSTDPQAIRGMGENYFEDIQKVSGNPLENHAYKSTVKSWGIKRGFTTVSKVYSTAAQTEVAVGYSKKDSTIIANILKDNSFEGDIGTIKSSFSVLQRDIDRQFAENPGFLLKNEIMINPNVIEGCRLSGEQKFQIIDPINYNGHGFSNSYYTKQNQGRKWATHLWNAGWRGLESQKSPADDVRDGSQGLIPLVSSVRGRGNPMSVANDMLWNSTFATSPGSGVMQIPWSTGKRGISTTHLVYKNVDLNVPFANSQLYNGDNEVYNYYHDGAANQAISVENSFVTKTQFDDESISRTTFTRRIRAILGEVTRSELTAKTPTSIWAKMCAPAWLSGYEIQSKYLENSVFFERFSNVKYKPLNSLPSVGLNSAVSSTIFQDVEIQELRNHMKLRSRLLPSKAFVHEKSGLKKASPVRFGWFSSQHFDSLRAQYSQLPFSRYVNPVGNYSDIRSRNNFAEQQNPNEIRFRNLELFRSLDNLIKDRSSILPESIREQFDRLEGFISDLESDANAGSLRDILYNGIESDINFGLRLIKMEPTIITEKWFKQNLNRIEALEQAHMLERSFYVNIKDFKDLGTNNLVSHNILHSIEKPFCLNTGTSRDLNLDSFLENRGSNLIPFMKQLFNLDGAFNKAQSELMLEMSNSQPVKILTDYVFPLEEYAAASSIYSSIVMTSMQDMPSLLLRTKNALIDLLSTIEDKKQIGNSGIFVPQLPAYDNADLTSLFNFIGSAGPLLPCGSLPDFAEDFWQKIWDILKYIPTSILAALAMALDPAYRDMYNKFHSCNPRDQHIRGLNLGAVSWGGTEYGYGIKRGNLVRGTLNDRNPDGGLYAPLLPAFPADLIQGLTPTPVGPIPNPTFFNAFLKLANYIIGATGIGGGLSGGVSTPCFGADASAGSNADLLDGTNAYGHPLLLFGPLALAMNSALPLPADNPRTQNQLCAITEQTSANSIIEPNSNILPQCEGPGTNRNRR